MKTTSALIAGPALGYRLTRYGFEVTVVEKAPELRPGSQAVDFKGVTHRTVLSRMGILDDVRRAQTGGQDGTVVDAAGRRLAVVPGEFSGGEIEIVRGDLARLLYDRTSATCGTWATTTPWPTSTPATRRRGTTSPAGRRQSGARKPRRSSSSRPGRSTTTGTTSNSRRGRNRLFSVSLLFEPLMKLSDRFATDIDLEDYDAVRADGR